MRRVICSLMLLTVALGMASFGHAQKTTPAIEEVTPNWIWLGDKAGDGQVVHFRKVFKTNRGRITGAKLFASCDNEMTVFINGKKVLESKNWSTPSFADVLQHVKRGQNVIAVRAKNSGSLAGLLAKLVLESSESKPLVISTNASWKAREKPAEDWKTLKFKDKAWSDSTVIGTLGDKPWDSINAKSLAAAVQLKDPTATPIDQLKVPKGFKVELLYSVPKEEQGSWVNMAVDPKGRLIVSDQYGSLYRVTPPAVGKTAEPKIEKINVDIGESQGLLWAFDSLYVMVNTGGKFASGLYRVKDTDGDDQLDSVEKLRKLNGGGEHGPHAVLPAPDGKSLYVVAGNGTKLTDIVGSRVPQVWGEDQLLPRIYGRGFMRGVPAPGGCIYKIDPDGKNWELISMGFRNEFDIAFNRDGELFTYDADMEWDMNTPWYRPTRVCHVVSGAEFGWRNGAGKWPAYYPDSLPAAVNIGPGSPTGITFGYGAKFPTQFQDALYLCDWSYGVLYSVNLKADGASYTGEPKEFISGTPLPLTDIVVNPHDGAMYFTIGGRRTKSGLYRVTYTGTESTAPSKGDKTGSEARALRRKLESYHGHKDPEAVKAVWSSLGHKDRFIRWAARVAIEHQDPASWQKRALKEKNTQASLTSLLALARVGDKSLQPQLLKSLERLDWSSLSHQQKITLVRIHSISFSRMGEPAAATKAKLSAKFDAVYPAESRELDSELCQMMVYLQAPTAAAKSVKLLLESPTQEEQIAYAKSIRLLKTGWTHELQEDYFKWFLRAANYRGGASFDKFVQYIKDDAVKILSDADKLALKAILEAKPERKAPMFTATPRKLVKEWKMDELVPLVLNGMTGRNFDKGRKMFGAANCFACHRFDNEGGAVGPDLTGLSGRFSIRDLLESVADPSKVISDQYSAVTIVTVDGKVVTGRIINLAGDSMTVNTDMLDPSALVSIDRKLVEEIVPSKTSMMPNGLLNTLNDEEILDLMAYLLSRGNRNHKAFQKASE